MGTASDTIEDTVAANRRAALRERVREAADELRESFLAAVEREKDSLMEEARDRLLVEIAGANHFCCFERHRDDVRIGFFLGETQTEEIENHPCVEDGGAYVYCNIRDQLVSWVEHESPESIMKYAADFRSISEMLEKMAKERG